MNTIRILCILLVIILLAVLIPAAGIAVTFSSTITDKDWVVSEFNKYDYSDPLQNILQDFAPEEFKYFDNAIETTVDDLKPFIDTHVIKSINEFYRYIYGQTDEIIIGIPLTQAKSIIINNLKYELENNPPPEYAELSTLEKDLLISQLNQELDNYIPDELLINEEYLGTETTALLQQLKYYYSNFEMLTWILLSIIIILLICIFLLFKKICSSLLAAGLILSIEGLIGLIIYISLLPDVYVMLSQSGIPSQASEWAAIVLSDFTRIWGMFNVMICAIGIILIVVSMIIFRRQQNKNSLIQS
jgi:hypothetical protein